jgi:hypothetical protein
MSLRAASSAEESSASQRSAIVKTLLGDGEGEADGEETGSGVGEIVGEAD